MTHGQRHHSQDQAALRAALERFVEKPCTLSAHQARALLNELTGELGVCLAPEDFESIEAKPPTNPQAFAELVATLDGMGTGDVDVFLPVLRRVLKTFEGAATRAEVS